MRRKLEKTYCRNVYSKFGGGSVMVWGCISCDGIGPITKVEGRMNGKDYIRFYLDTCFPTCSQWDLGSAINLRQ